MAIAAIIIEHHVFARGHAAGNGRKLLRPLKVWIDNVFHLGISMLSNIPAMDIADTASTKYRDFERYGRHRFLHFVTLFELRRQTRATVDIRRT
jgi:hypothetical protein